MEQAPSRSPAGPLAPPVKRRKLRKGTSSCWECKRRKARCTFFSVDGGAADDVCRGCKHRGTRCIPQDLPDQPPSGGSNRHLVDRLAEVEALVGRLVQSNEPGQNNGGSVEEVSPGAVGLQQPLLANLLPDELPSLCYTLGPSSNQPQTVDSLVCEQVEHQHVTEAVPHITAQSVSPTHQDEAASESCDESSGDYHSLCKDLLSAWPCAQDMDLILASTVHASTLLRGVTIAQPAFPDMALPTPEALLESPSPTCHPTLIARKLLLLATFLQGIAPASWPQLEKLTVSRNRLMTRAAARAHRLVNCDDELVTSMEGIECLMLEALFESYRGRLRPSWLASRRAATIAQMLGLHRGVRPASLTGLAVDVDPGHVWFRLVQMDRYQSMMLGLPIVSADESFASPAALASCTAEERMQRLNCAAAGRLLRRSCGDMLDRDKTKEIDRLLEDASASLPPRWWLMPTLAASRDDMDMIRDTLRFNGHFMHYHMVLHLHLPYLVSADSSRECGHSRATAISASREILSRVASFRTFRPTGYYCRGLDLLAFLSGTTLGLAHICSHGDGGLSFLGHQRWSDRGLLEHTLQHMLDIASVDNDAIASMAVTLLEHLLAIEEDAAAGSSYVVTSSGETGSDAGQHKGGSSVALSDDGSVLTIHLPHIGAVNIQRGPGQDRQLPLRRGSLSKPTSPLGSSDASTRSQQSVGEDRRGSGRLGLDTSSIWRNPSLAQLTPFAAHEKQGGAGELDFFVSTRELGGSDAPDAPDEIDLAFFNSLIQEMPV